MRRDEVALLAILILVLVPLAWIRWQIDRSSIAATKRVFESWRQTWRRLGRLQRRQ